jgi:hypothetical protein
MFFGAIVWLLTGVLKMLYTTTQGLPIPEFHSALAASFARSLLLSPTTTRS